MNATAERAAAAAQELYRQHQARERFAPLSADLLPADMDGAYAIQDALVAGVRPL